MTIFPTLLEKRASILVIILFLLLITSGCTNSSSDTAIVEPSISVKDETPIVLSKEDRQSESISEESVPPQEKPVVFNWEVDSPENHAMNPELLGNMHSALATTDISSVIIIKDGYLIDEYYKEGYDESSVMRFNSSTKSITSALFGIAVDQGLIDSLDNPISEYFPEVIGTDKESITIRHLLEHTSGIEWYEWGGGVTNFFEWRASDNWVEYILNRQMVAEPGTTFNYTTGGTHLLAAILQQETGKNELDFATEYLFTPMGIDSVQWGEDPQGISDGGNGVSMTPRDAAQFGQLFLQKGSWEGQLLISQSWVEQSTSVQVERSGASGSYGFQWWVRPFGDLSYDGYYAMGAWGQYIIVIPELELVTVLTSAEQADTNIPLSYFEEYILEAYIR